MRITLAHVVSQTGTRIFFLLSQHVTILMSLMYMTLIPVDDVSDEIQESPVLLDEVYDSLARDTVSTDHLLGKSQGDTLL